MQNAGQQYGQGGASSHQAAPFGGHTETTTSSGSITSSLRQFRRKNEDKQSHSENNTTSAPAEAHVARVAPHSHYPPRSTTECYRYPSQYPDYGLQQQPVKYSEISEPHAQLQDHLTPSVIQKAKTKEYMEMCNVQQQHMKPSYDHLNGQQTYPDANVHPHTQYLNKDSQVHHGYKPESQYYSKDPQYSQQHLPHQIPKYPQMPSQVRKYPPGNDFLSKLQRIHPTMARSIMTDHHLQESQSSYQAMDQNRMYPIQNQRYINYPSGMQNSAYSHGYMPYSNYPASCSYNRPPQMAPRFPPANPHERSISPRRGYPDNMGIPMNYGGITSQKISPNYPQYNAPEYAQHYQHRRAQMTQEYYQQHCRPNQYLPHQMPPQDMSESRVTVSDSIKHYIENWADEETASEMNQMENSRLCKDNIRGREDQSTETVYMINASELQYLENEMVTSENGVPVPVVASESGQYIIKSGVSIVNGQEMVRIVEKTGQVEIDQNGERVVNLHIMDTTKPDCMLANKPNELNQRQIHETSYPVGENPRVVVHQNTVITAGVPNLNVQKESIDAPDDPIKIGTSLPIITDTLEEELKRTIIKECRKEMADKNCSPINLDQLEQYDETCQKSLENSLVEEIASIQELSDSPKDISFIDAHLRNENSKTEKEEQQTSTLEVDDPHKHIDTLLGDTINISEAIEVQSEVLLETKTEIVANNEENDVHKQTEIPDTLHISNKDNIVQEEMKKDETELESITNECERQEISHTNNKNRENQENNIGETMDSQNQPDEIKSKEGEKTKQTENQKEIIINKELKQNQEVAESTSKENIQEIENKQNSNNTVIEKNSDLKDCLTQPSVKIDKTLIRRNRRIFSVDDIINNIGKRLKQSDNSDNISRRFSLQTTKEFLDKESKNIFKLAEFVQQKSDVPIKQAEEKNILKQDEQEKDDNQKLSKNYVIEEKVINECLKTSIIDPDIKDDVIEEKINNECLKIKNNDAEIKSNVADETINNECFKIKNNDAEIKSNVADETINNECFKIKNNAEIKSNVADGTISNESLQILNNDAEIKSNIVDEKLNNDVEIKNNDREIKNNDEEIKNNDAEIKNNDAEIKNNVTEIKNNVAEIKNNVVEEKINKDCLDMTNNDAEMKNYIREKEINNEFLKISNTDSEKCKTPEIQMEVTTEDFAEGKIAEKNCNYVNSLHNTKDDIIIHDKVSDEDVSTQENGSLCSEDKSSFVKEKLINSEPINEEVTLEDNVEVPENNEIITETPITKVNSQDTSEEIPKSSSVLIDLNKNIENKEVSELDVEPKEIPLPIQPEVQYRHVIRVEESNVLLEIAGELVEINVNNINGKNVITVVPLSDTAMVDFNDNYETYDNSEATDPLMLDEVPDNTEHLEAVDFVETPEPEVVETTSEIIIGMDLSLEEEIKLDVEQPPVLCTKAAKKAYDCDLQIPSITTSEDVLRSNNCTSNDKVSSTKTKSKINKIKNKTSSPDSSKSFDLRKRLAKKCDKKSLFRDLIAARNRKKLKQEPSKSEDDDFVPFKELVRARKLKKLKLLKMKRNEDSRVDSTIKIDETHKESEIVLEQDKYDNDKMKITRNLHPILKVPSEDEVKLNKTDPKKSSNEVNLNEKSETKIQPKPIRVKRVSFVDINQEIEQPDDKVVVERKQSEEKIKSENFKLEEPRVPSQNGLSKPAQTKKKLSLEEYNKRKRKLQEPTKLDKEDIKILKLDRFISDNGKTPEKIKPHRPKSLDDLNTLKSKESCLTKRKSSVEYSPVKQNYFDWEETQSPKTNFSKDQDTKLSEFKGLIGESKCKAKVVIDVNDFNLKPSTESSEDEILQNYKVQVESKLNNLNIQIPRPKPLDRQIADPFTKSETNCLIDRFLKNEKLSSEEMEKIRKIISYKRLVQQLKKIKSPDISSSPMNPACEVRNEMSKREAKLLLKKDQGKKKTRFRNLYSQSESASEEDFRKESKRGDYSVVQSNCLAGVVPKLIIKRKTEMPLPVVRLERLDLGLLEDKHSRYAV
ncbi:unnamed protein product [Psylliodes chrysocephalus]|uniref:Uncharacterized protein n=1 Tax=Psylliodes chrysocephalus TaxID=3402493 RepID=A0A9P0D7Q8_9CUCU|nr:unnamed protein product [Psylliodes chrysocephala]